MDDACFSYRWKMRRRPRRSQPIKGCITDFSRRDWFGGLVLGAEGHAIKLFFLGCVIIAGVFGAATVGRKILYVQAVLAAVAVALNCWAS